MSEFFYKKWLGGYPETVSGSGSMLKNTENVRKFLPNIIRKYDIKSIFDAPCGDRNWIKTIDFDELGCKYYGGDIVGQIVKEVAMPNVSVFDLRYDKFPDVDLWFCRDCLYHLSIKDINMVMHNVRQSNVKYILVTSHTQDQIDNYLNRDIKSGDYRCLILSEHNNFGLGEPVDGFWDCNINLSEEMLLFVNTRI